MSNTLDRLRQFLTLIGLTALLVGGVGIANAVATFIDKRRQVIATMKSVGATSRMVLGIFLAQIAVVAVVIAAIFAIVALTAGTAHDRTLWWWTTGGFLVGALFSAISGYVGMNVAVRANVRVAQAARSGLEGALKADREYLLNDGVFRIDADVKALGLSNRDPKLLDRCVEMLGGADAARAKAILERYVPEKPADWKEWLAKNKSFAFTEDARRSTKESVQHGPKWDPDVAG